MSRLLALLMVTVVLTGCAGAGSTTPKSTTVAGAQPAASSCRLPVVVRQLDSATRTWSAGKAGFLTYPGGGLAAAAASGVRYDDRLDRWLPAGLSTPDGISYVYGDDAGAVHQVTPESGLDQVIVTGGWVPLGFIRGELYLAEERPVAPTTFAGGGYTEGGLAQTSPSGGKPIPVTQHNGPWWVSSIGGWTLDRADGLRQAPDRLLHVDLATGAIEPWLTGLGNAMLVGFDASGHPFVVTDVDPIRILLVTDRENAKEVYRGSRQVGWPEFPSYIDGNRVWFSGFGLAEPTFEAPAWLYLPASGLRPAIGVVGAQVSAAGPCRR